jgi:hypothetical protein
VYGKRLEKEVQLNRVYLWFCCKKKLLLHFSIKQEWLCIGLISLDTKLFQSLASFHRLPDLFYYPATQRLLLLRASLLLRDLA